jgi:hypothetical protein
MLPAVRDHDVFAGELKPILPARRVAAWVASIGHAIRTGMRAGAVPALYVFAVYFGFHHELDMPWVKIFSVLVIWSVTTSMMLAAAIQGMTLMFDRVPFRPLFNPVTAGTLGGAIAGIFPGALAVSHFGAYAGPFAGTGTITTGVLTGALLIAVPLARRGRRDLRRAVWPGTIYAAVILALVAALLVPAFAPADEFVFMRDAIYEHGVSAVGGAVGGLGGAVLGFYCGCVMAFARRPVRDPADR